MDLFKNPRYAKGMAPLAPRQQNIIPRKALVSDPRENFGIRRIEKQTKLRIVTKAAKIFLARNTG